MRAILVEKVMTTRIAATMARRVHCSYPSKPTLRNMRPRPPQTLLKNLNTISPPHPMPSHHHLFPTTNQDRLLPSLLGERRASRCSSAKWHSSPPTRPMADNGHRRGVRPADPRLRTARTGNHFGRPVGGRKGGSGHPAHRYENRHL